MQIIYIMCQTAWNLEGGVQAAKQKSLENAPRSWSVCA